MLLAVRLGVGEGGRGLRFARISVPAEKAFRAWAASVVWTRRTPADPIAVRSTISLGQKQSEQRQALTKPLADWHRDGPLVGHVQADLVARPAHGDGQDHVEGRFHRFQFATGWPDARDDVALGQLA